jgi:hypothetical protein
LVINVEFPAGVRAYYVHFALELATTATVVASSEEDARQQARAMLVRGELEKLWDPVAE